MKLENINVTDTIEKAKRLLAEEKKVSPAFKAVMEILLLIVSLMLECLSKNTKNSSIPPSQDPNRTKTSQADKTKRKAGGQLGRIGKNLNPLENPDEIIEVPVDRTKLPSGHTYKKAGFIARQVVEIHLSRHVKEYRLEILKNEKGRRYTAEGPIGINRPIQYGSSIKSMAVSL
jgi:transposase